MTSLMEVSAKSHHFSCIFLIFKQAIAAIILAYWLYFRVRKERPLTVEIAAHKAQGLCYIRRNMIALIVV